MSSNSAGECDHSPLVVPCEYVEARTMNNSRAFWVTLNLLIEESGHVTSFLHFSDLVFNTGMARECGFKVTSESIKVLCNEDFMPGLYAQIIAYENVLDSLYGKERKRKYTFKKH